MHVRTQEGVGRWLAVAALVVAGSGLMAAEGHAASPPDGPAPLCGGEPCDAVVRGLFHFFDRGLAGLGGNGRSCGDCHMVTDRFQLSPANVERRFQLLQLRRRFDPGADDPLFRPIDADDFRTNGEAASEYGTLRQHGLVRISSTCRRT